MKSILGVLLALTAIGVTVAATRPAEQKAPPVPGARMLVEPAEHDFGKAKQDLKLEKEFVIKNMGSEVLSIGRISTSCGCTVAEPGAREIKPGQSTTMKVTLETRRYSGPIERTIAISSNDSRRVTTVKVKVLVEGASQD